MSLLERAEKELKEKELLGFKNLFLETLSLWSGNLFQIFITFVIPALALEIFLGMPSHVRRYDNLIALITGKAPFISIIKFVAIRDIVLPVVMSLFCATFIYYFFSIINDGKKKWGESFNSAVPIFLGLAFWMVIVNVMEEIGLTLLVIPGIYLAVRYCFVNYVVVLEKNMSNPLKRSWLLTQGFGWHILGYFLFLALIYIILAIPLYILIHIFEESFVLCIIELFWVYLFGTFCGIFYLKFYLNLKRLKNII